MPLESDSIANRLKKAMSIRDMKQIDLVEKTKIPKGSISQYLSGYAEPKTDRIYLLAKALDVNPVWLSGFDVPMETNIEEKFNSEIADLLVRIKNNKRMMDLARYFLALSDEQQSSVLNIVESMVPKQPQIDYLIGSEIHSIDKKILFEPSGKSIELRTKPCARPSLSHKDNPE